jgi:hypothetical protein
MVRVDVLSIMSNQGSSRLTKSLCVLTLKSQSISREIQSTHLFVLLFW